LEQANFTRDALWDVLPLVSQQPGSHPRGIPRDLPIWGTGFADRDGPNGPPRTLPPFSVLLMLLPITSLPASPKPTWRRTGRSASFRHEREARTWGTDESAER
jgi:hypothetical protein